MAIERDFITPAGVTVQTTANVVGNTAFVDAYSNTARAQTVPVFSQNFALNPRLSSRFEFLRSGNATYVAANGLIAIAGNNTPRFEYDPESLQCKGLLIEEGRANYVRTSSNIGNTSYWSQYDGDNSGDNFGVNLNAGTAPDGSNTATFFYHKTDVNTYFVLYTDSGSQLTVNKYYTQSVFLKANTNPIESQVQLAHYDYNDNVNSIYLTIPINANGSINYTGITNIAGASGANVEVVSIGVQPYPNGWNRIYFTFRYLTGTTRNVQLKHELTGTPSAGMNNVRGVYWWGAQLENGPFVTSYIPTTTSTGFRNTEYALLRDDNFNAFKKDGVLTVVDTSAALSYSANTTVEQRYNTIWSVENFPAPPPGPGVDSRYGAQRMGHYQLQNSTAHSLQHYYGGFNQVEAYAGFTVFNSTSNTSVNRINSDAPMVTTATVLRSNNFIFVANGVLNNQTLNYSALANNNVFGIGGTPAIGSGNMYLKRIAIYSGQLSNTEMINITTT